MSRKLEHQNKNLLKSIKSKKNNLKILIRTAGGKETKEELGLGHVYRCLNLASEMKPDKIHFLLEDFGGAKEIVKQQGFHNIQLLKKGVQLKDDLKITKNYLKKKKIDLVIVDRYHVKIKYLKELKKLVRLVVISDLHNIEYPADLIVNGFIGFKNETKRNSYGSKCLLGPRYQIIDKRFSEKYLNIKPTYDLLITVGGYDEKNIIDMFLKCVQPHITKIKTKIIVGPVGKKSKLTQTLEKKYPSHLKIVKSTKNMKKEIILSKFGICSGGITSYEFAAMKKPFAIICVVKHQLITATEWEKKGCALNFGMATKTAENRIKKFLHKIVEGNSLYRIKKRNLVDGKGASRVSHEILKIR